MAHTAQQQLYPYGLQLPESHGQQRDSQPRPIEQARRSSSLHRFIQPFVALLVGSDKKRVRRQNLETIYQRLEEKEHALTERLADNVDAGNKHLLVLQLSVIVAQKKKALRLIDELVRG